MSIAGIGDRQNGQPLQAIRGKMHNNLLRRLFIRNNELKEIDLFFKPNPPKIEED